MTNLTWQDLIHILNYDPLTGNFRWNFNDPHGGRRVEGKIAGSRNSSGYILIHLNGAKYRAHRLAWLYIHHTWPGKMLDHINGNKSDNRISNLRLATRSQNFCNRGKNSNNTSGYKGVSWNKRDKNWTVHICVNRKQRHGGSFKVKEDAVLAYNKLAVRYHGAFARLNII